MSKLNIDQKSIGSLFEDKKSDFLIPDYQRPYEWTETHCLTLWEDLFDFAFPQKNKDSFNRNEDYYYLGPVVTFKNEFGKLEIIDGQQRLTTLMLLLRAFYVKFVHAQDNDTVKTRESIAKCIWKTDEFGNPDMNDLKIDSEVATDNDKEEFLEILKTGKANKDLKSKYAINYRFFQEKIDEFVEKYAMFTSYFPIRIMNNCILLPIEADNQDTALRIFSTLNDRGMPLSDADIFKAQFYKYYKEKGQKDSFIEKWKELEDLCGEIFHPNVGTPMDELFTRYMYYERAKKGTKGTTTEALKKFYEGEDISNKYAILKKDETLTNLMDLAKFWKKIVKQDKDTFSEDVLKKLFVLNYAPNGMWTYILSVYYLANRDENKNLNNDKLYKFLTKIIAFIWGYALTNPGVNALRTPVYPEMRKIVNNEEVTFENDKFESEELLKNILEKFNFYNGRPITKAMLTWWAFENKNQEILKLTEKFEIEHIYSKKREENENALKDKKNIESLGNKSILEKHINIRASDYRFVDKKKYYEGFTKSENEHKKGTNVKELLEMKEKEDFTENDIEQRNKTIINSFIKYLKMENLIN